MVVMKLRGDEIWTPRRGEIHARDEECERRPCARQDKADPDFFQQPRKLDEFVVFLIRKRRQEQERRQEHPSDGYED